MQYIVLIDFAGVTSESAIRGTRDLGCFGTSRLSELSKEVLLATCREDVAGVTEDEADEDEADEDEADEDEADEDEADEDEAVEEEEEEREGGSLFKIRILGH
jgi:hypothetical protein